MAFTFFFLLLLSSHLFLTPTDQLSPANSGEITTNYGPKIINNNPSLQSSPSKSLKGSILHIFLDHGSAIAGAIAAIITLANMILYKTNKLHEFPDGLRRFSLEELRSATENFNEAFFLGRGGFGAVYRGLIDNGKRKVAVKRLSFLSFQGRREFYNEVKALSSLKHANLVSLVGYCKESREMIIVYEFMPNGTLADKLYEDPLTDVSLSWEQRLRICVGAARGLDYLHTGTDCEIIHRDVKPSNILLDKDLKAKVSDFGMARISESAEMQSHVSTVVKGTHGYMDPAYCTSQQLTRKSDVYSFGVVLLEVLFGRKASKLRDVENLREFASEKIVDSHLEGQISPKCLKEFVKISEKCLHDDPKKRPTMGQLIIELELLLDEQVGKNDAEIIQDLDVLDRKMLLDILDSTPLSFGLWPREAIYWNKEVNFIGRQCHCFSPSDIIRATNNFSPDNVIIRDGLYTIYQGGFAGKTKSIEKNVAFARFNRSKDMPNISMELHKLSYLDHPTLASIVGYCCSGNDIIVVYEYNGRACTFFDYLDSDLPWLARLGVCFCAAKALRYLHMGTMGQIIHGDISPTAILMQNDSVAMVVSFGSIVSHLNTHNTVELKHLPPDMADSAKSTEKTDVYLFGLLLLVALCGKGAYYNYRMGRYPLLLPGAVSLAVENKTLHKITHLDPRKDMVEESLSEFLEIAFGCLSRDQVDRPSMDAVADSQESSGPAAPRTDAKQEI